MDCPKCGFALPADAVECPRCGIIIAKFLRAHDLAIATPLPDSEIEPQAIPSDEGDPASREWRARAAALPGALLCAWLAVKASPGAVRLLTMWVHESGHATTAWICGYLAVPGPWFTPVSENRSPFLTMLLVSLIGYGGYRAWQANRWFWIVLSACGIALVLMCTLLLTAAAARQLIIFDGDGGSLVLGTALMLTMYARADHPIRRNHLRWAFVVIGALAIMDTYTVWTGPIDRLPLGENENGLSDPSVLTEGYGWNLLTLIARYGQLAHLCLAVLAVVYVAMLFVEPE